MTSAPISSARVHIVHIGPFAYNNKRSTFSCGPMPSRGRRQVQPAGQPSTGSSRSSSIGRAPVRRGHAAASHITRKPGSPSRWRISTRRWVRWHSRCSTTPSDVACQPPSDAGLALALRGPGAGSRAGAVRSPRRSASRPHPAAAARAAGPPPRTSPPSCDPSNTLPWDGQWFARATQVIQHDPRPTGADKSRGLSPMNKERGRFLP